MKIDRDFLYRAVSSIWIRRNRFNTDGLSAASMNETKRSMKRNDRANVILARFRHKFLTKLRGETGLDSVYVAATKSGRL